MAQTFYLTTPIYYVNDQPHLGHAYSTLLADVMARYYRSKIGKDNVWLLVGTDEHGAKVAAKAEEQEMPVEVFVSTVAEKFQQTWKNLQITNDDFIRTTEDRHVQAVTKIMGRLRAAQTPTGAEVLYRGEYEGLYCQGCEKFLTERDLVDGMCPLHPNQKPQVVKESNWFFRLTDFLPQITEMIENDTIKIIPEERKNEALGYIKQGMSDFSVSREKVSWGIPLPWEPTQTIYVWIEALMNYITAIGYPTDEKRYDRWWPAQAQVLGPDILKFHAIFWPAMLLALKLPLPEKLYVHGFFTVDGQKMSKSIGNVIDPNILVEKFGPDATRYLILSQFSFGSESDIKVSDFTERYNADLANGLGNLVARLTNLAEKYLPAGTPIPQVDDIRVDQINSLMESMKYREALQLVWQIISECDLQLEQQKPWELIKTDEARVIMLLTELLAKVRFIGQTIAPVMPATAERIAEIFTAEAIRKPANLFNRLES
jgi:methionyl-tRNA synthetase